VHPRERVSEKGKRTQGCSGIRVAETGNDGGLRGSSCGRVAGGMQMGNAQAQLSWPPVTEHLQVRGRNSSESHSGTGQSPAWVHPGSEPEPKSGPRPASGRLNADMGGLRSESGKASCVTKKGRMKPAPVPCASGPSPHQFPLRSHSPVPGWIPRISKQAGLEGWGVQKVWE